MSKRIPNTIGFRKEMEERKPAIGLNASGSYVLRSFDSLEYNHVLKVDFSKLIFSKEEFVVVARGTSGSLVRFAQVTPDLRYAKYFGNKFVSIALIEGQVFSKTDFILSIVDNPTLHVLEARNCKEHIGILHGEVTKKYKSLIYPLGMQFMYLDIEDNPPPQSTDMRVRILGLNPGAGAGIKSGLLGQLQRSQG